MKTLNKVQLIGHVGKEPEVKQFGETKVVTFSLATNDGTKDKEDTNWHRIKVFNKLGEIAEKYINKGSKIYIEGKINYSEHEGKYYTDITAYNIILLDSKGSGSENDNVPF